MFEVVTLLGPTLLDVRYVEKPCRIGDVEIALVDGAHHRIGLVDVFVAKSKLPPRELPYARGDDKRIVPYLGAALAVHLVVWGVATTSAPPAETRVTQREPRPVMLHSFADAVVDMPEDEDDESLDDKEHGSGTPMELDEGAAGAREVTHDTGHIAVEQKQYEPALSRSAAIEAAREAGVIGSSAITSEQLRVLAGSADLTSAFDEASVNGALAGGEGASAGSWGTSYAGDLRGGGGDMGTIGTGAFGAFSNGISDGEGWGAETVPCGPGGNLTVEICKKFYGKQCIHDGVSPRVTVRVVDRRRPYRKLARCWVDAFHFDHEVTEGPLRVDFTIQRDGRVTNVRADGITEYVERCVEGVYAKIKFPRTRNATDVRHMIVYKRSTYL